MKQKPMLAYPVSDKPIDYSEKVFMQPKLDGVRCLIQQEYDEVVSANVIRAYSRTGKEWKNINHILYNLRQFFHFNPNAILDGELYNHDLKDDFEKIISLVRKQDPTPEDRSEAESLVQFHCYDIVNPTMKFDERIQFVTNNVPRNHCVCHVPTMLVPTESQAQVNHARNLDSGYEGSILRINDFYQNKRSHSLRKFKDFSDAEATIIDFVEGKGKRKGTLGKFVMRDADGIEFGCPPGKGYNYKDLSNLLFRAKYYVGNCSQKEITRG